MPSLDKSGRHIVIDKREGEYLAFPDVISTADDRLIVAYNQADRHVEPTRRVLVLKESRDLGVTWSAPVFPEAAKSHCPRLLRLPDDMLMVADAGRTFQYSVDNGDTWTPGMGGGLRHDMLDTPLVFEDGSLLTTGHCHRGTVAQPAIGQAPAEQMVYRSTDLGRRWLPLAPIARERNLVLCEASMVKLPDGQIAALMRENSFVGEPMYVCLSSDGGETWGDPLPTPLVGHRPTMGMLGDKLLVTYRNVGPNPGTCAWLGTLDELLGGFQVHGSGSDAVELTDEGMRFSSREGDACPPRYLLRPMTDPRKARAALEFEVRVDRSTGRGCGVRLGCWWQLGEDFIVADVEGAMPVPLEPGKFHSIIIEYSGGNVHLWVNNKREQSLPMEADRVETRPALFGTLPQAEGESVATWRRVNLSIDEVGLRPGYRWEWRAEDGFPDAWAQSRILELENARQSALPDFGYSGWTELEDGAVFCVYHHGAGDEEGYVPLETSCIKGIRFGIDDFS